MRFRFDHDKCRRLRENRKRGIGFEEVQEIFSHPCYEDRRSRRASTRTSLHGSRLPPKAAAAARPTSTALCAGTLSAVKER